MLVNFLTVWSAPCILPMQTEEEARAAKVEKFDQYADRQNQKEEERGEAERQKVKSSGKTGIIIRKSDNDPRFHP